MRKAQDEMMAIDVRIKAYMFFLLLLSPLSTSVVVSGANGVLQ
jgi:hypothetical protein